MEYNDWQRFQERERQHYLSDHEQTGSYFGHFSVPEFYVTDHIADRVAAVDGPILDIGCGVLPMPNYLKWCIPHAIGIDPYFGEHRRQFPFAQAVGERLPFKDKSFGAVLLMSVLDHTYRPDEVLREARRMLKNQGLLFIWYVDRRRPDPHHPWCLPGLELSNMLTCFGFTIAEHHTYPGDREIGFPRTCMLVAEREAFGNS